MLHPSKKPYVLVVSKQVRHGNAYQTIEQVRLTYSTPEALKANIRRFQQPSTWMRFADQQYAVRITGIRSRDIMYAYKKIPGSIMTEQINVLTILKQIRSENASNE